jgi:hypothetical protein
LVMFRSPHNREESMGIARLKRIAALERRQPRGPVWVDPFPVIMKLWPDLLAVAAGRACWRKLPAAEPWSEETQAAFDRAMAEHDSMHRRLTAERPKAA